MNGSGPYGAQLLISPEGDAIDPGKAPRLRDRVSTPNVQRRGSA